MGFRWQAGISAVAINSDIAIEVHNSTPYIAFVDVANSNTATVMRHDGSSRVNDGGVAAVSTGSATKIDLSITSNGDIYLTYIVENNSDRIRVMKIINV